jgi:hypothetical protein
MASLVRFAPPTVMIFALFYLNIASIIQAARTRVRLPQPTATDHLFRMFSLFSGYTTRNKSYEAEASIADTEDETGEPRWIPIDLTLYFPQVHGEANRRINLHSVSRDNAEKRQRDYARLVDVIRLRHNREHPDLPIDRLRIYLITWPKDKQGRWERFEERQRVLVYSGPPQ